MILKLPLIVSFPFSLHFNLPTQFKKEPINKSQFSSSDKKYMQEAINRAKQKNPALAYELNFIEKLLLMKLTAALTTEDKALLINFIMRLQQFTGPLMAKGVEDTFLYNYNRLISLNDVGGNPGKFGISINEFHYFNIKRTKSELNSSSTHDTKRGEDVRARINVLSEIPYEWENKIKTWKKLNKPLKNIVNRIKVPDYNDEYFLYQTLIGAWPFDKKEHEQFISRIKEYIIKAVREAKVHTAWLKPDADYENVYLSFIEKVLNPSDNNEFLKDFLPFQKKVAHFGMLNSISQTLLKITSTGIPDIYQGSELWDLNLVDPDNRRKVDFEKRYNLIKDIDKQSAGNQSKLIEDLLKNPENGAIKLFLIYKALNIRKTCEALSIKGKYIPLEISGEKREHVVAYARELNNQWAITVAPRLLTSLINEGEFPIGKEIWKDTQLLLPIDTHFKWKNIFTNQHVEIIEKISIGDILTSFPVSLLLSIGKED